MNSWVSFIYDAAAVAIILICMARGAKDGFAKAFVQTVGLVVSVAAALYVSRVCASLIYGNSAGASVHHRKLHRERRGHRKRCGGA